MARKTGPSKATVTLVHSRSGGLCEVCGFAEGQQIHHRKPRGMGGTRDHAVNGPTNLLDVCYPCHRHIEENRAESRDRGHLVNSFGDPAAIPVLSRGTWKLLDYEGGYVIQLSLTE